MQPEHASVAVDFSKRADPALLPELMDEPCNYETFRDTVRDLGRLNRVLLAYRPTLQFVNEALAGLAKNHSVSILDVGAGGGDMLREIARWAFRHSRSVRLTGIDLNPHATRVAQEFSAQRRLFRQIRWVNGSVFDHAEVQSPDLVVSSLVTHHMEDDEIVRFLRWMEEHAARGWFISDLLRSARSYQLFRPLTQAMRAHAFVKHDGLVSIRRGFREPDWLGLLERAGIPSGSVRLHRTGIGRLCLTRLR